MVQSRPMATSETPLLELGDVRVTNTKVTIGSTSYFLANITSVKLVEDNKIRTYGILAAVIGVIIVVMGIAARDSILGVAGVVAVAVGVVMYRLGVVWELNLTTGAAERQALRSRDKASVVRVLAAINVAVENRTLHR